MNYAFISFSTLALGSCEAQISKSIAIPAPSSEIGILNSRSTYVAPEGTSLIQEYSELVASDTFGKMFLRRSADNGKTWTTPVSVFNPIETSDGVERQGETAFLLDSTRRKLIRFFNRHSYPGGIHTKDVYRLTTLWYEVSTDEGTSFSAPEQLILDGCSAREWAPEVRYGENCMVISFCNPFVDSKGRIVLPVHFIPPPEPGNTDRYPVFPMKAACFFGTWKENGGMHWKMSRTVTVDSALSSRGLCEPTVAELADGRFLMICRGSNVRIPEVPGRKWVSISEDGGEGWSAAKPLTFDDGEPFYSPATGSQLIRHSRTHVLYWIGNILPDNPNGNNPRYPLWIARVDEVTGCLIRDSLCKIDDKKPEDTDRLQLSNFRAYEDRLTGEFVLTMARIFERSATSLTSPAYEYRIPAGQ